MYKTWTYSSMDLARPLDGPGIDVIWKHHGGSCVSMSTRDGAGQLLLATRSARCTLSSCLYQSGFSLCHGNSPPCPTLVYIHPRTNASRVARLISRHANKLDCISADAPKFGPGDFNHCQKKKTDLCYGSVPAAYTSIALPLI